MDIIKLVARMIPSARKDMARPVAVKDTLSTAGRATVLTASEVLQELKALDEAKEDKRVQAEATKRVPEQKVAETAQKDAGRALATRAWAHEKVSRQMQATSLTDLMLRMWPPTLAGASVLGSGRIVRGQEASQSGRCSHPGPAADPSPSVGYHSHTIIV